MKADKSQTTIDRLSRPFADTVRERMERDPEFRKAMQEDMENEKTTKAWEWGVYLWRWHIARWMIHTAIKVAPPGHSRDELTKTLWDFGDRIMEVVSRGK